MGVNKEIREKQKQERLGEISVSLEGYEMKIVEYNSYTDIVVEFQDEHKAKVHTTYQHFKKDKWVKNPYHPRVFGVGYFGQGKYVAQKNKNKNRVYQTWKGMLQRCYDPYYINEHLTYIDCYVCEEWHNFQVFAEWYYENYYEIEGDRPEIEKDILIKDNKIYSPQTCIFVPRRINILFVRQQTYRGEYPIGVCENNDKARGYKYLMAQCCILDENRNRKRRNVHLGHFPLSEPFHAFYVYKQFKENYIKQVADEYKDLIPTKLYEAMYKYEVEIND